MSEASKLMGEFLGDCPHCTRPVTVYDRYCYDDESGKWFHTNCYLDMKEDQATKKLRRTA